MKYLGIDYGDSKIGLALGDSETGLALPFKIIANEGREKLFSELIQIISAEEIDCLVIGWPLNVSSQQTEQTKKVNDFVSEAKLRLSIAVETNDERFSSQEAKKMGAGKRDDDVAAMLMLQNYLDGLN